MKYTATMVKTQEYLPKVEKNILLAEQKELLNFDFRLVYVDGACHIIIWKDGRKQELKTRRQFEKLAKKHSWKTDF